MFQVQILSKQGQRSLTDLSVVKCCQPAEINGQMRAMCSDVYVSKTKTVQRHMRHDQARPTLFIQTDVRELDKCRSAHKSVQLRESHDCARSQATEYSARGSEVLPHSAYEES